MLYICDNGGSYSEHTVWYLESALPRAELEPFLRAYFATGEGHLLAVCERYDWFGCPGESLSDLDDVVVASRFVGSPHWREEYVRECRPVMDDLWAATSPAIAAELAGAFGGREDWAWDKEEADAWMAEAKRRGLLPA